MVKHKKTKEVPQWVRDFIIQRQRQLYEEQHSKEDEIAQMGNNVYLINPYSQDEVELIRNGVWKLREEASLDRARENRKRKEAGKLRVFPGFSRRDDLFDIDFRPLLLVPLKRQEMQEAVLKHCGWEKWSEDPWGDAQYFYEWLVNVRDKDDTPALWAINETLAGRTFLAYCTLWALRRLAFSKMTDEELFDYEGFGAMNFRYTKRYTGWEDFHSHYPAEPLPAALVNKEIIKVSQFWSFNAYISFVVSIYLWGFASAELNKRTKEHPELAHFLSYTTATDTYLDMLRQELAPKGYQPPDENEACQELDQALKGKGLKRLEKNYGDVLETGDASKWESLLEAVNYWKPNAYEAVIAGLKGHLGNSLLNIIQHNFMDATRKAYRKHDVTESQIDATQTTNEGDITHFLDTIPTPEPISEEPIDLKNLGFDLDELTTGEIRLLNELSDAVSKGYQRYSKEGLSLSQYWDREHDPKLYERKMKMYKRLEAKLKKP